jgi:hypothetical protein
MRSGYDPAIPARIGPAPHGESPDLSIPIKDRAKLDGLLDAGSAP